MSDQPKCELCGEPMMRKITAALAVPEEPQQ